MSQSATPKKIADPFICLCNGVRYSRIQKTITDGANTTDEIYDKSRAGVGACGGSCRDCLKDILKFHQENGSFPQVQNRKVIK